MTKVGLVGAVGKIFAFRPQGPQFEGESKTRPLNTTETRDKHQLHGLLYL